MTEYRGDRADALAMPFDRACSMNVSMNIADKRALYREIHRVLKPGARLVLSKIVQKRERPIRRTRYTRS